MEVLNPGQWTSELLECSVEQDLANDNGTTPGTVPPDGALKTLPQDMEQEQETNGYSTSTCLKMPIGTEKERVPPVQRVAPRILLTRKQVEMIGGCSGASHTVKGQTHGVSPSIERSANSRPGVHLESAEANPIPAKRVASVPGMPNERLTAVPLKTNDSREIQEYFRRLLDVPLVSTECQPQVGRGKEGRPQSEAPPNDKPCKQSDQQKARRRMKEREYGAKRRARARQEREELITLRKKNEALQNEKAGLERENGKLTERAANLVSFGRQLAELIKTQKAHLALNQIRDQNQKRNQ